MKRPLVDTDITLDLLAKREPFYRAAASLFSLAEYGKIELYISALTLPNLHYLLRKSHGDQKARDSLETLLSLGKTIPLSEQTIKQALSSDFGDFEDAIQNYSAIEAKADVILTRNLKDYKNADLPVLTADEFLASIK